MNHKFQSSRNSKRIGLAALIFAAILLASCPDPTPDPEPTVLAAPDNLRGSSGDGRVSLRWDAVSGAVSYHIYRDDMRIAIQPTLTLTYTDETAVNGERHVYTVRAVDSNGLASLPSNAFNGSPLMIDFNNLALAENSNPVDIWSNGTTMWVLDGGGGANNKIFAYSLRGEGREPAKDFNTLNAAGNTTPVSMWSNGTTMWVLDQEINDVKIFAYHMNNKERDESQDFNDLADDGLVLPAGIWSDDTTMWLVTPGATEARKILAYSIDGKARDDSKDIDMAPGNTNPRGIWSHGDILWVSDGADVKIYAYSLSSRAPVPAQDISLDNRSEDPMALRNEEPFGMWSNAETIWVVDNADNKLYTYNLPTGEPIEE